MRVITGVSRGRILRTPRGKKIRPTSSKVKAAFFNIVAGFVNDACFLDLFSGTGSMGIEALSRGAKKCVFVEKDPQSLNVLKENLRITDLFTAAQILPCSAHYALRILSKKKERFQIVYLDPPYEYKGITDILFLLAEYNLLANKAIIGVERNKKDSFALDLWLETAPFQLWQRKVYGNTSLLIFKK